MIQKPEGS